MRTESPPQSVEESPCAAEFPCLLLDLLSAMADEHEASVIFRNRAGAVVRKSYAECYRDALAVAAGFDASGVRAGDIVALHGATSYAWLLSDMACVLTGAISLALYPSAPLSRILSAVKEMKVALLLTDDAHSGRELSRTGYKVVKLTDAQEPGAETIGNLLDRHRDDAATWRPVRQPQEPFTIVSTSGTLSEPRFFAVHSWPLLYTMERFGEIYQLSSSDSMLLALPLAHLPQRMLTYGALKMKVRLILSGPTKFLKDATEFKPTIHVVVPRMLEYINARLTKALETGAGRLMGFARPVLKRSRRTAFRLLGSKIFGRGARYIFVGSAPTPKSVLAGLKDAGCPIYEVYGTTEMGMIALNTPQATRVGSVGKTVGWGELKIDEESQEVFFATKFPFLHSLVVDGKIVREEKYAREFIPTGDVGTLDEGFLTLRGRIRDFVALLNGEKIFVRPIEDNLNEIEGANACVVVGNGQKELSAVIFADPERRFESREEKTEHFRRAVAEMNRTSSPWERVRKILIVDELPSIENGCLTETLKLRRHVINRKYANDYRDYQTV